MRLDERLRDYLIGRFTDEDIVHCTGLSARGSRELIKFRVVRTITENDRGRGHVRLCDATVFKRAATIAALNRAGFSLAVAGRIAYFLPFHTVLFEICDPGNASPKGATDANTRRALPLRFRNPNARWFNPNQPAKAAAKTDWLVQIYDRRFVGVIYRVGEKPAVFGDLREEATRFVAWVPHDAKSHFVRSAVAQLAMEWAPAGERLPDVASEWEEPTKWFKELRSLWIRIREASSGRSVTERCRIPPSAIHCAPRPSMSASPSEEPSVATSVLSAVLSVHPEDAAVQC